MKKPFVRSINNRVFAGVFGAIADYFGWDASLVRLGGALLLFFYQGLFLLYLAAALLLKEGYTAPPPPSAQGRGFRAIDDFLHKISSKNQIPLYVALFFTIFIIIALSQWLGSMVTFRILGPGTGHLLRKIWGLLQLVAVAGLFLYWMKRRRR